MRQLTVILCTHSPHRGRLDRTLESLRKQSLPVDQWEFLLIDNASREPLEGTVDLSWHPAGCVVREERLGLTNARLCGIATAGCSMLVWVDDDNILDENYLQNALAIFLQEPQLGIFGGRALPEFESPPGAWFDEVHGPLGLADHGPLIQTASAAKLKVHGYPSFAPVGAGMCARAEPLKVWANAVANHAQRRALGRTGANLASGEDNDIVLTAMEQGWDIGYFPQLSLVHIMPAGRLTSEYHARLLEASNRTWVLTLGLHGISPWPPIAPWTLGLRKLRAAIRMKPWSGTAARLNWKAACGKLAGRADLFLLKRDPATTPPVSTSTAQPTGASS